MKMFSLRRQADATPLSFRSVVRSHIGKVRMVNEDRLLDCPDRGLWAIADGMGGHHLGDKAATIVVRALAQLAEAEGALDAAAIVAALDGANSDIMAISRSAGQICGSTVAALHIDGCRCTIVWAGDSRIYRLRDRKLQRLSHDHSVVQELTDAGIITEAQGRYHPQSNVITRAIGIDRNSHVERGASIAQQGDRFLLCSDGLSSQLSDDAMLAMLSSGMEDSANRLLNAALDAGGSDNISLILVGTGDQG